MYGYTAYSSTKFALRGLAEVLHMELKPHNINVSISFPPDTGKSNLHVTPMLYFVIKDTPQLQDEMKHRSSLVKELATYGTTLKPEQIANEV